MVHLRSITLATTWARMSVSLKGALVALTACKALEDLDLGSSTNAYHTPDDEKCVLPSPLLPRLRSLAAGWDWPGQSEGSLNQSHLPSLVLFSDTGEQYVDDVESFKSFVSSFPRLRCLCLQIQTSSFIQRQTLQEDLWRISSSSSSSSTPTITTTTTTSSSSVISSPSSSSLLVPSTSTTPSPHQPSHILTHPHTHTLSHPHPHSHTLRFKADRTSTQCFGP